jgi:hypothetical protein
VIAKTSSSSSLPSAGAVDRVGLKAPHRQLQQCLTDDVAARDEGYEEGKFERLFLMLT